MRRLRSPKLPLPQRLRQYQRRHPLQLQPQPEQRAALRPLQGPAPLRFRAPHSPSAQSLWPVLQLLLQLAHRVAVAVTAAPPHTRTKRYTELSHGCLQTPVSFFVVCKGITSRVSRIEVLASAEPERSIDSQKPSASAASHSRRCHSESAHRHCSGRAHGHYQHAHLTDAARRHLGC